MKIHMICIAISEVGQVHSYGGGTKPNIHTNAFTKPYWLNVTQSISDEWTNQRYRTYTLRLEILLENWDGPVRESVP